MTLTINGTQILQANTTITVISSKPALSSLNSTIPASLVNLTSDQSVRLVFNLTDQFLNPIQINQISAFDEFFDQVPYEEWVGSSIVSTGTLKTLNSALGQYFALSSSNLTGNYTI